MKHLSGCHPASMEARDYHLPRSPELLTPPFILRHGADKADGELDRGLAVKRGQTRLALGVPHRRGRQRAGGAFEDQPHLASEDPPQSVQMHINIRFEQGKS